MSAHDDSGGSNNIGIGDSNGGNNIRVGAIMMMMIMMMIIAQPHKFML